MIWWLGACLGRLAVLSVGSVYLTPVCLLGLFAALVSLVPYGCGCGTGLKIIWRATDNQVISQRLPLGGANMQSGDVKAGDYFRLSQILDDRCSQPALLTLGLPLRTVRWV